MQIRLFKKETIFKQHIKVAAANTFQIKTEVEFMACNDENCLPPAYDELELNANPVASDKS